MQEGDAAVARSDSRGFIDQPEAEGAAALQRGVEIRDPEADMVDAGTTAGEKPGYRAVVGNRLEKLDGDVTQGQRDDRRPVGGFGFARREPEHIAVEGQGFGNIEDGHAYMGDPGFIGHEASGLEREN
jgi:hypothetical protein